MPQLGSQIYAMYGMTTHLNLQADQPGSYLGLAAHFNGNGFPDMAFNVEAVSAARFSQWIGEARATGPVLDQAAYHELSKQTSQVALVTYRDVQKGLFDAVVRQQLPPGPGPTQAGHRSCGASSGLAMALLVLAVAQMGVHLVFFLHITTAADNTNNILALAFGVLIVCLIVFGSLWVMSHLNQGMGTMEWLGKQS